MLQTRLIQQVREVCERDDALLAAMLYGSFAKGGGDQLSDIDCVLFFRDDVAAALDQRAWLSQIAPVEICYVNEFGITDVIFANLVRGEFHFDKISNVAVVATWAGTDIFPSLEAALIVDKAGLLMPHLQRLVAPEPPPVSARASPIFCQGLLQLVALRR